MANNDKETLKLIQTVKAKKAEIASLERPDYKTNCCFSFIEGQKNTAVNLHVETDVRKLIGIAACLIEKEHFYKEAAKKLSLEQTPDFKWDGYSVAEWTRDIQTRISKIQIATKREKLNSLEERLNKIISPELRAQMELEAISKELT